VRVIIDDDNWYDYIKLLAKFIADIGYKGLIVLLDEAIHLTKITTTVTRQNNYDKLLAIFNDAMQGRVSYLGAVVGGTPQFLEDPRRGLYSDPAWQRRTRQSRVLSQSGMTDLVGPVIRLEPLTPENLAQLLQRLSQVHQLHYNYSSRLEAQDFQTVLRVMRDRLGADRLLTPGEIVRDFMGVLNVLQQNPSLSLYELLKLDLAPLGKAGKPTQADLRPEFAEFTL
jgi:hypothetical protein